MLLKRPSIGSYYNPVFWTWIIMYILPYSLLPFSEFSIHPLISLSAACIFVISLYYPPSFLMSTTCGFARLGPSMFAIIAFFIALPFLASLNVDASSISDFGERNSAIRSLPLQVVILALGSISTSFWSLSRRNVFVAFSILNACLIVYAAISFGYTSSKAMLLSVILQIFMVLYIRAITVQAHSCNSSFIWINHPVKSPFEHLVNLLSKRKIHRRLAISVASLPIIFWLQLYLLQSYGFLFSALVTRIVLNYDTLIYLSGSLQNHTIDWSTSGFFSIISVWAKPFLGMMGLNSLYAYKSVPQYVFSLYFGRFYLDSSLGNSNLVAESVVSSNLLVGCLSAPIIYYFILRILKQLLKAAGSNPVKLAFTLALITPYAIFSSCIEFIMKASVIGFLLACSFLMPIPKSLQGTS